MAKNKAFLIKTCLNWPVILLVGLIRGYQFLLSPWLGRQCRFYPSCSHYAIEALQQLGLIKGIYYTAKRLLRCHPFAQCGVDLVPVTTQTKEKT